jgi:hypothetical protein
MGVICDYFAAPSDDLAASVIEDGPTDRFPTVEAKGIDPAVLMGRLQGLLSHRRFRLRRAADPMGDPLGSRDDGAPVVVPMSEAWLTTLASASDSAAGPAATEWAKAEEFGGSVDGSDLEPLVADLIALAREARARGDRAYCWICV